MAVRTRTEARLNDEPITETYLEIVDAASGNKVLTAIEFLRPTNKLPGDGSELYLRKQREYRAAGINLVEIDLTGREAGDWCCRWSEFPASTGPCTWAVCGEAGNRAGWKRIRRPWHVLDTPTAISDKVERLLHTIVRSTPGESTDRWSQGWNRIESQILRWQQHPDELEDEGLERPSQQTIPLVREVCRALRGMNLEAPLRLVPNCEAGAVFEWRTAPYLWSVEVERDGALELSVFRTGRLVPRYRIA